MRWGAFVPLLSAEDKMEGRRVAPNVGNESRDWTMGILNPRPRHATGQPGAAEVSPPDGIAAVGR